MSRHYRVTMFLKNTNETTLILIFVLVAMATVTSLRNVTTQDQLMSYKAKTKFVSITTTTTGVPVPLEDTQTINNPLIFDQFFMETITHLNRERIPERVIHAKGTGAFGYFRVTHDLSDICRAKVFNGVGKTTPVAVRFSSTLQERGGSDVTRETKGMSIKFYTEEGNYDIVALNVPVFHTKDPLNFADALHAFRKNPKTQVPDANSLWDFVTLHPESLNFITRVFGDRGLPDGYRYLPAHAIHTFEMINEARKSNFVRIHVLPDAGIKTMTTAEAQKIQAEDLDYATRDLYEAIANQNYPAWTICVQVIPFESANNVGFDIFDITKLWPLKDFPFRPVGTLVLNRNPENHFAEIEQLAFNPGDLVPGIRGVDKQFEARVLAYRDAQNYRLGTNFNKISVNCPIAGSVNGYLRDGRAPVLDNGGESPNYIRNSFNGPVPYLGNNDPPRLTVLTDPRATNFEQASNLYCNEMSSDERSRLVEAVTSNLKEAERFIQERAVELFKLINIELGSRIALELRSNKVEKCCYLQN